MTELWWFVALFLFLTVIAGVAFVISRPASVDSMLAAFLFGTTGVALVLVIGKALNLPRAIDVALVLALLAAVLGAAFALRGWPEEPSQDQAPS
ncbi:MAG: multiple resistance and pH regulation protein F [Alphaproteobacteria bacterium]